MSIVDTIAEDLPLSPEAIRALANSSRQNYRRFAVDGRVLFAPKPELKLIQCWISDLVRASSGRLPSFVTAYEPGSSIVENASIHQRDAHHLYLDIRSFFPSCKSARVSQVFSGLSIQEKVGTASRELAADEVFLLTRLSTMGGGLAVGSPSSPAIANRILLPADAEIKSQLGDACRYSRYSDDICISSDRWIDKARVVQMVDAVLSQYGFRLNAQKTRCVGRGDARRITGVTVTPEGDLSIGARRKGQLKSELYRYLRYGEGEPERILGLIYFCKSIDPRYTARVLSKYSTYSTGGDVMSALVGLPG